MAMLALPHHGHLSACGGRCPCHGCLVPPQVVSTYHSQTSLAVPLGGEKTMGAERDMCVAHVPGLSVTYVIGYAGRVMPAPSGVHS